jgi:ATP-dependent Clp protease, protease subunit
MMSDARAFYARLKADNAHMRPVFRTEADEVESTLYLYDVVDDLYGVSAAEFVKAVASLPAGSTINLRINSPGGDVFAARAMATALRNHPGKVISHVDGLAASAASYIAIAADEVRMAEGSFLMVHRAWTLALGNADDLIHVADLLEKIDATLVADYSKRTGASAEQVEEWMNDETWFSASEAKKHGFADEIVKGAKNAARWVVTAYSNAPAELTARPEPEPEPEPDVLLSDDWRAQLRARIEARELNFR